MMEIPWIFEESELTEPEKPKSAIERSASSGLPPSSTRKEAKYSSSSTFQCCWRKLAKTSGRCLWRGSWYKEKMVEMRIRMYAMGDRDLFFAPLRIVSTIERAIASNRPISVAS